MQEKHLVFLHQVMKLQLLTIVNCSIEHLIMPFRKAFGYNRKYALVYLSFERKFLQTIDIEDYIKEFKNKNRRINL